MSEDETCRPVEVDGEIIRVLGGEEMDDTAREAFADLVRAAKRKFAAERLRDCEDCEQGKHAGCLVEVWDDNADDWAPCPCHLRGHR